MNPLSNQEKQKQSKGKQKKIQKAAKCVSSSVLSMGRKEGRMRKKTWAILGNGERS